MQAALIHICTIFALYILSAFSTTDILRLLCGCETSILSPSCFCPQCGRRILLRHQIPIVSYIRNKGSCRSCGSRIPKTELFLEAFLFTAMTLAAVLTRFSWTGFFLDLVLFELTKLCFLCRFGIRRTRFFQELCISLILNIIEFLLLAFLFFLPSIL